MLTHNKQHWLCSNNPFFFGQDYAAQQRWREQQERRRILAELDEEDGGAGWQRRRSTSNSSNRTGAAGGAAAAAAAGASAGRLRAAGGGDGDDEEEEEEESDMSFLDSVYSLLFGDGHPGPSENERWMVIARLIHSHRGVVCPEEVMPLLAKIDPNDPNKSMLPVLERFAGVPIRCESGLLYDFGRMREGVPSAAVAAALSPSSSVDQHTNEHATLLDDEGGHLIPSIPSTPPPTSGILEERRYTFR